MKRLRASCRLRPCALVLTFVGDRIGEDELRVLRRHLAAAHPDLAIAEDAPAGTVLAYYIIEEVVP